MGLFHCSQQHDSVSGGLPTMMASVMSGFTWTRLGLGWPPMAGSPYRPCHTVGTHVVSAQGQT